MTHEEKLRQIIEAQVKGGCTNWEWWIPGDTPDHQDGTLRGEIYDIGLDKAHLLQILLDTEGLKAAYPGIAGEAKLSMVMAYLLQENKKDTMWVWQVASYAIMEDWHKGKGNNWKASIDTAYKLLPTNE